MNDFDAVIVVVEPQAAVDQAEIETLWSGTTASLSPSMRGRLGSMSDFNDIPVRYEVFHNSLRFFISLHLFYTNFTCVFFSTDY